jgi:hypothetical protein
MRLGLLFLLGALACSRAHEKLDYRVVSAPRDWTAHPAIAETDATGAVSALSDVHGGTSRMIDLLRAHHVIDDAARWSGGDAILVVAGDLFDKGPAPLEAVDLLRALEPQAASAGGRVIFTVGNHEAEFLDDPENDKATKDDGVDVEIRARGEQPVDVAGGRDPRGAWLRDAPFGARIRGWFFAHAGDTHGRTVRELGDALRAGVIAHDYHDEEIVGPASLLESRDWYADPSIAPRNASALGVRHIVFGHQPSALGPRGEIATARDGLLFRIDCGMSPGVDDSSGRLLRVRIDGGVEVAESLAPDGAVRELWRGPR